MSNHGRWIEPQAWSRCDDCRGRGYIVTGTVFGRGMQRETCPTCRGVGIVNEDHWRIWPRSLRRAIEKGAARKQ